MRIGLAEERKWVGTERRLEVQSSSSSGGGWGVEEGRDGEDEDSTGACTSSDVGGGGNGRGVSSGRRMGGDDSEGRETRRPVHLGVVDVEEELEGLGGKERWVSR